MQNDIQQRVLRVICDVSNRKEDEIKLEASIRDDLQFDSLKRMTLVIALEDEFQRSIPPEQATGLVTIRDIVDFVVEKMREPATT